LGYIPVAESLGISSTTFMQCAAKSIEFGEVTQNNGHYAVQGHSKKITDFSTNQKLIRLPVSDHY